MGQVGVKTAHAEACL